MTRFFLFVAISLMLASCSAGSSSANKVSADTTGMGTTIQKKENAPDNILADTVKVKKWLTAVIENYTNGEALNDNFENLKQSLTADYCNYKQDAINLEYDNGDTALTEETFKKKWQDKYNIKFVGSGGYIISAQDNGKVKVTTCNFIKNKGQNAALYKVVIEDLDYKSKFNRDIKVIAQNGKLLIDDIVEYD